MNVEMKKVSYVTYWFPGLLFAESRTKKCSHRDPEKVELPKGAYSFHFEDRWEGKDPDGNLVEGKADNVSKTYVEGEAFTVKDLKKIILTPSHEYHGELASSKSCVMSNVEGNGYKGAIKTSRGNWLPRDENSVILGK